MPLRTSQFKHILKLLARQILGTRWARYPLSRCRAFASAASWNKNKQTWRVGSVNDWETESSRNLSRKYTARMHACMTDPCKSSSEKQGSHWFWQIPVNSPCKSGSGLLGLPFQVHGPKGNRALAEHSIETLPLSFRTLKL